MSYTETIASNLGYGVNPSSFSSEQHSVKCYQEIYNQIFDLWVGNNQGVCLGGVFSWILNDCKKLDKTDPKIQELFKKFQRSSQTL